MLQPLQHAPQKPPLLTSLDSVAAATTRGRELARWGRDKDKGTKVEQAACAMTGKKQTFKLKKGYFHFRTPVAHPWWETSRWPTSKGAAMTAHRLRTVGLTRFVGLGVSVSDRILLNYLCCSFFVGTFSYKAVKFSWDNSCLDSSSDWEVTPNK